MDWWLARAAVNTGGQSGGPVIVLLTAASRTHHLSWLATSCICHMIWMVCVLAASTMHTAHTEIYPWKPM